MERLCQPAVSTCLIKVLLAFLNDFTELSKRRDFVRSSGLAEVQFTVLTPFPGTPLYARVKREGRLLTERYWDRCTLFDVNYRPARMTVEELESGLRWLFRETYSAEETQQRRRGFARQVRAERKEMVRRGSCRALELLGD